jgi:adenosylcobinamide kinase/adenosylcobinamide-phosphate guanylyltransferase
MNKQLIFILGGARSGKSAFAERLARRGKHVLFVATAEALDEDMQQRITIHRSRRPEGWDTLEEPVDLAEALQPLLDGYDVMLLDCLTLWVSNLLLRYEEQPSAEKQILGRMQRLLDLYEKGSATWIVVSNEVGLGVVPPSSLGRAYRDALGRTNQTVASRADRVYLMAAGLALELKSLGARPFGEIDDV